MKDQHVYDGFSKGPSGARTEVYDRGLREYLTLLALTGNSDALVTEPWYLFNKYRVVFRVQINFTRYADTVDINTKIGYLQNKGFFSNDFFHRTVELYNIRLTVITSCHN